MKIEKLTKNQQELVKDLYRLCFAAPFDSESITAVMNSDDLWEFVWGVIEDDLLLSSYVAYQGQVKIRSISFDIHYFDGFVTRPGYRNLGMGRKLFEHQREVAKETGIKLFALDPFKNSYYKQFGFEDALDLWKIEIPMRNFSNKKAEDLYPTKTISMYHSELANNVLRDIYEREWSEGFYNPMHLPDAYFKGMFQNKSWKLCFLKNEYGQHIGSMLYEIKERTMTVYKLSFFDLKGLLTFRDFLAQFRDQIDTIHFFKAPPDFPIDIFTDTYHAGSSHVKMQIYPTRMIQILDIEYAIKKILTVLNLPEMPLAIKFIDKEIKENNKILSISKEGVKSIRRKNYDLVEMEVSDFVPIFTGKYLFSDQFKKGKIKMEASSNPFWNNTLLPDMIQHLDRAFEKTVTHNNEFCF
ncbi:MAG: GNAT family N-acetyltransferase [Thermotogota bacterium]